MRILLLIFVATNFVSCNWDITDSDSYHLFPTELSDIPADPNNPITIDKFILGDTLFHTKALSLTGKIGCVNCHLGDHGGSLDINFPGGIGEGATPIDGEYVLWDDYHGKTDSMTWVQSRSLANSAFRIRSGLSGRFGGTMDPVLRQDIINHFDLHEIPTEWLDKIFSCHATIFQAFVAYYGHNQFHTDRLFDRPDLVLLIEQTYDVKIDKSMPEHELVWYLACAVDVFQRVKGLRNQSKFQQALRGEADLSSDEMLGYKIMTSSTCAKAEINGQDYSCHGGKDFGGDIAPSVFPNLDGVPDAVNDITGRLIADSTLTFRTVPTIFGDKPMYGPHGTYTSLKDFLIDHTMDMDSLWHIPGLEMNDGQLDATVEFIMSL